MKHEQLFTSVEGEKNCGELTVYALSTCGFCKRALSFLRTNSIRFRFLYIDDLPMDIKEEIKSSLYEKFHETMRYPFMVIDGKRCLIGFTEDEWKDALLKG